MRVFLIGLLSFCFIACIGQKNANIYLSHCDSLFYAEGDNFDATKIKKGKMTDSAFINALFSSISPTTHKILFKPYTDVCITGDGMSAVIINWKALFSRKGFGYETVPTNSAEDNYFGEQSIYAYIKESAEARKNPSRNNGIPPAPPPPPLSSLIGKNKKALTILVAGENKFYYYNGSNCTILNLVDLKTLKQTIRTRVKTTKKEEIIIVIKSTQEATFKSILDILDEIVLSGTPKYHYAEEDITQTELNCIKKYKKNK